MNPGRKPANNRALSRRFTAGTPAEKVEFLSARLDRLINGLRLFAGYCDFAPNEFRSEVKQFIDLAEIELREGLKALHSGRKESSPFAGSLEETVLPTTLIESVPTPAIEEQLDSNATSAAVDSSSAPLLSAPNSNLNSPGMSFDSMAQMAEVPEANDLEAILARLQSYGEALDNGDVEGRNVGTQSGNDARELLLGFEVCRMDSDQSEAVTQPDAQSDSNEAVGNWANTKSFAACNEATSLTTQYTEITQFASAPAPANSLGSQSPASEDSATTGSDTQDADSVAGEDPTSISTEGKSESQQIKPLTGSGTNHNSNSARESNREHSENSSPVNLISPENLLEINALKDELNSMLSQFKSPGAVSNDS